MPIITLEENNPSIVIDGVKVDFEQVILDQKKNTQALENSQHTIDKQTEISVTLQANIDKLRSDMESAYAQYPRLVPQDIIELFKLA